MPVSTLTLRIRIYDSLRVNLPPEDCDAVRVAVAEALWALHCWLDWRDFREVDRRNRLRAALRRLREERRAAALRENTPR